MNIRKLRKLQRWILAEPRRFNMTQWAAELEVINEQKPPCDTVGCLAGMACHMEAGKLESDSSIVTRKDGIRKYIPLEAARILDLDNAQAGNLFLLSDSWSADFSGSWPPIWESRYYQAKTLKGKARVAARYIDFFIKKKGKVNEDV